MTAADGSTQNCPGHSVGQADADRRFECSVCGRRIRKQGYSRYLAKHQAPADLVEAYWQDFRERAEASRLAAEARAAEADDRAKHARITVSFGGRDIEILLAGSELSETRRLDGSIRRYLNNASRGFVADEVEAALIKLVAEAGS